jgi:choline dehydrogenase-like flavoprotein
MHCVIGSGPAGVACAQALLRRGAEVRLLDAGIELEPDRAKIVRQLGAGPPSSWLPEHVAVLKESMQATAKGIPLKRVFGSDFPYRDADLHVPATYQGVGILPSLALGGFSNVWGAAMLPGADADLGDWPVKNADLSEHYRAVLEFTGLSAQRDDLERVFPLYLTDPGALQLSRQAHGLLAHWERHRAGLQADGLHFGRARLAVRAARSPQDAGCVYCGLCMYGCPYGYIYNSADTVRQMQQQPRFTYQPDTIVTALRETAGRPVVEGYHRKSREHFTLEAGRVYLAAGVIPTTKILLQSLAAYDRPQRIRDSQYFLVPMVLGRRTPGVQSEALYTLSQLFLEIQNPRVNRHVVHLQVYSYNDLIGQGVRRAFGPLARPLSWLARRLEERLVIVQGYLHSDDSASILMTLKRGGSPASDRLQIQAELNPETPRALRRVVRTLLRHARSLGGLPLPPLMQVAEPGRGFHSGGSFPMRSQPGPFESDRLGRPQGWQRIHVVDASVFPSVPASAITLSVMANAHRIGWEGAALV